MPNNALSQIEGGWQQVIMRDNLIHQPHLIGPLGGEGVTCQKQLQRPLSTRKARQPLRAAKM